MAETTTVTIQHIASFKKKALQWANYFRVVCLFDNNQYPHHQYQSKDWLLAVDTTDELLCGEDAFEKLKAFQANSNSTIFGYFSYDLKNQLEKLESKHADNLGFADMYFFKPRYIIEINGDKLTVNRNYPETFELIELINNLPDIKVEEAKPITLESRTAKADYINNVEAIRQQIAAGDFYELNYCNELYAEHVNLNPLNTFLQLNESAKAPFSSFFKHNDKYMLCASPERFLRKEGNKLISQPIKGTIRKGDNAEETAQLKQQLQNDIKERAENVMIVDLVRNDLARSSKAGTVKVEELFSVYEFNTVQQMISTVVAEMRDDVNFADAIKHAFPMGSMTGAPKVMVMETIEQYENFKRGLYSGAVGYIDVDTNFDFNVVIRSIFYNADSQYLSIRVGGAITYDSIPEKEYEEMLLKASSLLKVLNAELR